MNNCEEIITFRGSACGLCCTQIEDFGVVINGKTILKHVNIHIHCGQLTALIGPNGSGKTTLLKAILGEVHHSGQLRFLDAAGNRSGKPRIGYVPQRLDFDLFSPTSVDDLFAAALGLRPALLGGTPGIRQRCLEALSRVQAEHLHGRRLGALSGGELQRVLLALALDPLPDLLLLDEPISGVDYRGMQQFYKTVSDLREHFDLSIILVSHDLRAVAGYADRIVLLNQTVLADGPPKSVIEQSVFQREMGHLPAVGDV